MDFDKINTRQESAWSRQARERAFEASMGLPPGALRAVMATGSDPEQLATMDKSIKYPLIQGGQWQSEQRKTAGMQTISPEVAKKVAENAGIKYNPDKPMTQDEARNLINIANQNKKSKESREIISEEIAAKASKDFGVTVKTQADFNVAAKLKGLDVQQAAQDYGLVSSPFAETELQTQAKKRILSRNSPAPISQSPQASVTQKKSKREYKTKADIFRAVDAGELTKEEAQKHPLFRGK